MAEIIWIALVVAVGLFAYSKRASIGIYISLAVVLSFAAYVGMVLLYVEEGASHQLARMADQPVRISYWETHSGRLTAANITLGLQLLLMTYIPSRLKTCPHCAERIKVEAKVCRYCRSQLA